jgi:hypothetical protein
MREYGLDALALLRAIERLLGESVGLTEQDLLPAQSVGAHRSAAAEDL